MLISSRRLKWLAMATLITCAFLLFPSTRSWIQRASLPSILGPNWSAQDIVIHSQRSVVETRGLQWHDTWGARGVELVAQRGWFAFDDVALVDRTFLLPKVILQEADLRICEVEPPNHAVAPNWKQQLAMQISKFDWDSARQKMDSLIFARELSAVWIQRIERWVSRSQQIVAEVEHLESEVVGMDNPLRFEETIQLKLPRLQELAEEQSLLLKQFDTVEALFESEAQKLETLAEKDRAKLLKMTSRVSDRDQERESICEQVAMSAAQELWAQLAPFAEVVDRLTRVNAWPPSHPYDVNVRCARAEHPVWEVAELKASGVFQHDLAETAYQAQGQLSQLLDAEHKSHRKLDWQFQFQHKVTPIGVLAELDSKASEATKLRLTLSEGASGNPTDFNVSDSSVAVLTLASREGLIEGTLVISSACQGFFHGASQQLLAGLGTRSTPASLRFDVRGEWGTPRLELMGAAPDWWQTSVKAEVDREWGELMSVSRSQLENELLEQKALLRANINKAMLAGQSKLSSSQAQLLAAQTRIQARFDALSGIEFARRPGTLQR